MPSAPEKIRAAIERAKKKYGALEKHLRRLNWSLKNAQALQDLAGWVVVYRAPRLQWKFIFPIKKNCSRRLNLADKVENLDQNKTISFEESFSGKRVSVSLGDGKCLAWNDDMLYFGFFATRKEARQFVEDKKRELENSK
ncbi:MAG: hypothetical protein AAB731_03605 [Patescibacteria group bacterium]